MYLESESTIFYDDHCADTASTHFSFKEGLLFMGCTSMASMLVWAFICTFSLYMISIRRGAYGSYRRLVIDPHHLNCQHCCNAKPRILFNLILLSLCLGNFFIGAGHIFIVTQVILWMLRMIWFGLNLSCNLVCQWYSNNSDNDIKDNGVDGNDIKNNAWVTVNNDFWVTS